MSKQEFYLSKPLLNAPGFLGFAPNPRTLEVMTRFEPWGGFGAFVTDPISWRPRSAALDAFLVEQDGQVILRNGWPNRGFRSVVKAIAHKWEHAPLPIIPSILEIDPLQALVMIRELEGVENLAAVNLMPHLTTITDVNAWLGAIPRFNAELPIMITLPVGLISFYGGTFVAAGIAAIAPTAPHGSIERDGKLTSGRLYGPVHFPAALALARECAVSNIPLVAAGGVDTEEKLRQLREEGVVATFIDMPLWQ